MSRRKKWVVWNECYRASMLLCWFVKVKTQSEEYLRIQKSVFWSNHIINQKSHFKLCPFYKNDHSSYDLQPEKSIVIFGKIKPMWNHDIVFFHYRYLDRIVTIVIIKHWKFSSQPMFLGSRRKNDISTSHFKRTNITILAYL